MPVSVNAALRESLAGSEPGHQHHHHGAHQLLQSQMASSTKHLVLKNIEYEEYPENFLAQNDALKSKYILLSSTAAADKGTNGSTVLGKKSPLNGNSSNGLDSMANGGGAPGTPKKENKNELPLPKRILFPRDKIRVGWKGSERKWQVGAGFVNVGNTCYLNSTLQALLHVPAMANWLASDTEHRESWSGGADMVCCTICAVAQTLLMSQKVSHAVKPYLVYSRLRSICKHMAVGRQEDAHEFLRYLIDAMEKAYLERFNKGLLANLDQYSKETTPLNQILGFYLRSSVRCLSCNHVSITFQHFEDLLLDIRKSNTVDEALQGYFARETLEEMDYTCSGCKKKVSATKQFSIERPPVVLCIQLKRFSIQGNKLNKQVSIRPKLDLTPYVRKVGQQGQQPLTYRLVSMVTHLGSSQHCGHYTAIGLTESGAYYQFDDSSVHPIALQNVLQTNAYIMFYELESAALQRTISNGNGSAAAAVNSPTATVTAKTNGVVKQQLNGVSGTKVVVTNGNGASTSPHANGNGNLIGPVLPPNHPLANKEQRSLQNGHASPAKKDSVTTNGGGFGASVLKLNKAPTAAAAAGSAIVKKYPSAELLFKSPAKQQDAETPLNGTSPAKRESPTVVPKSLVPYNSNLSSDEDEDDEVEDEEQTVGHSKEKKENGQSYVVHSNNGVWKVEDEPASPPQAKKGVVFKGTWKSNNGNGKAALNELLKMDHSAYGGVAVSTWSGEKSNIEKETSDEKNLKRSFMDRKADDEEMDRGHVKKLKTNNKVGRDNPGFNPFQEAENKNNQQQGLSNGGGYRPNFNGGNRNNHHHHHNNHHSNGQQSRTDWVNNGRPNGGMGYNKFKWNGGGGGGNHNNRPQNNHNRNWGKFNYKKHGHQRHKGNFGGGGGNRHHNGNRPNH